MEQPSRPQTCSDQDAPQTTTPATARQPWHEPKLTFVEPQLTVHGDLQTVTGQGFFGGFTP